MPRNLTMTTGEVRRAHRESLLGQRGAVVWLTGLSGSGKTTLAYELEQQLHQIRRVTYVLDGDNIRHGLCRDLSFSPEDRAENVRRIGEVAALFIDAGLIVIAAFISPYRADRQKVRDIAGDDRFIEVYLDVPASVCEQRDAKGLYARARAGEIPHFTGVSAPYEGPLNPEITVDTRSSAASQCARDIIQYLDARGFIDLP